MDDASGGAHFFGCFTGTQIAEDQRISVFAFGFMASFILRQDALVIEATIFAGDICRFSRCCVAAHQCLAVFADRFCAQIVLNNDTGIVCAAKSTGFFRYRTSLCIAFKERLTVFAFIGGA